MSGVGVIIKKDAAKKMLDEGWGTFKKVYEKGASIRWCNDQTCVNMFRDGNQLCVNRLLSPTYPFMPTLEACGDPESVLTYALILMEAYSSNPRMSYDEAEKRALERLIERGAVGVSTVGDEYIYPLAREFAEVLTDEGFPELTHQEEYALKNFLKERLPFKTLWERRY